MSSVFLRKDRSESESNESTDEEPEIEINHNTIGQPKKENTKNLMFYMRKPVQAPVWVFCLAIIVVGLVIGLIVGLSVGLSGVNKTENTKLNKKTQVPDRNRSDINQTSTAPCEIDCNDDFHLNKTGEISNEKNSNDTLHPSKNDCHCGPGKFVQTPCNDTHSAICKKCRSGTFKIGTNDDNACKDCNPHNCPPDSLIIVNCTATTNLVCKCKPGHEEEKHPGEYTLSCFPKRKKDEISNGKNYDTDESSSGPKSSKGRIHPGVSILVSLVITLIYNFGWE